MSLEQSILTSTKKILNVGEDDSSFDLDIITHINTAFSHLHQLGIGPVDGFVIEDAEAEWGDFLEDAALPLLSAVKTNVHLRVRVVFDPPQLPHVMNAMQEQLLESDTRILMIREQTGWTDPDPPEIDPDIFADEESPVVDGGDA